MEWVPVKTYKGHDLMVTQDGKIVCYIDGTRKVFQNNGDMKVVKSDECPGVDKFIIDEFIRGL